MPFGYPATGFSLTPRDRRRYTARNPRVPPGPHRKRLLPYILIFIAVVLTVTGELFLKHGMNQHGVLDLAPSTLLPTLWTVFTNRFVLIGFCFIFSASVFWLSAISRIHLSVAYPMLSTGYIIVVLASAVLFGEPLTWVRLLGVAVIMGGITLVFQGSS